MTRTKRGSVARKRRKKLLTLAQGFQGSSRILFRSAMQRVMKSLARAFQQTRFKKRVFRGLWISRINAAVRYYELNYNTFMYVLKVFNCHLNRKWLSQFSIRDPINFETIVKLDQKKKQLT